MACRQALSKRLADKDMLIETSFTLKKARACGRALSPAFFFSAA